MGDLICGMRRFEIAAVDVERYDRDTATLRVLGKSNKKRLDDPGPSTASRYDVRVSEEDRRATRGLYVLVGDSTT